MQESLTVGELKKALAKMPDELPVYASLGMRFIVPGLEQDTKWYVEGASRSPRSSISNEHFCIELGDSFGW